MSTAVACYCCVYCSADRASAAVDPGRGQLDVGDAGDGRVAERRLRGRVIRRGSAGDGNLGLADRREQHSRQRRQ